MRRVSSLGGEPGVEIRSAIGVNLLCAVRLVVVLALSALEARVDLGANTDALADLNQADLGANLEDLADNLVADGQRVWAVTPVAVDGVLVAGADTAGLDLDVDIVVAKGTRLPRALLEIQPVLLAGGLEAFELVGVSHFEIGDDEDERICRWEMKKNEELSMRKKKRKRRGKKREKDERARSKIKRSIVTSIIQPYYPPPTILEKKKMEYEG